jgi:KRAB domain-containing zinc finger protein
MEPLLFEKEPKNFECPTCLSVNWHSHIALRKHMAEEHRVLKCVCDVCGKLFTSVYYMKFHKRTIHEGLKLFACSICSKDFGTLTALRKHEILKHDKDFKFKCDICNKGFTQNNILKKHQASVHIREVKYECNLCRNFVTFSRQGLTQHVNQVHHKIYSLQCPLCPYIGSRKFSLNIHHRIVHLKEKKHWCEFCDYATFSKSTLTRHTSRVHKDKLTTSEQSFKDSKDSEKTLKDAEQQKTHQKQVIIFQKKPSKTHVQF